MTMMIMRQIKVMTMMTSRILMTMMIIRQMNYDDHNDHETEESIIVLFSVSTQALDTITGLWQTLPDLLVPRLITPYYHLVLLGYHGLPTLLILIALLILLIKGPSIYYVIQIWGPERRPPM